MAGKRIAILGAGLAGLGAGAALRGEDTVIFEKNSYVGGHASTHAFDGFLFDEGPHISFTKNEKIRALFADSVGGKLHEFPGIAVNYFEGIRLQHPAQCHLYPLPHEIKKKCLVDMVTALLKDSPEPANYRDWCYRNFGQSFSETFVRKYTRKYWNRELEDLTVDWVGPRIHAPTIDQVVEGALAETEENFNYITKFRYPEKGGFVSFVTKAAKESGEIVLNSELKKWDPVKKTLSFANGKDERYDYLISSVPLPVMIETAVGAPKNVADAAKDLDCTSHFLVNVGLRGKGPEDAYWIYYYDENIPFSRVSFPSRFAPGNAPAGHWSLQAEVVHSTSKPLGNPEEVTKSVMQALKKTGLIKNDADVVMVKTQDIRFANVVFDGKRTAALKIVHDYLAKHDVYPCGRYGDWAYLWTDESFLSGERAAGKVKSKIRGALS